MNIDILADNPSFAWYFVVAVPFLVFVLVVTGALQHSSKIFGWFRRMKGQGNSQNADASAGVLV